MPKISDKGLKMPASPIRKLAPYAEKAKSCGVHVYHLNIGQPDIKTPKIALDAVKENNINILAYSQSEGSFKYRKKLAKYYHNHNINIEPTDIIITTGGSEALTFAFGTIMDPGDEVIIPEPFYANYNGFSAAQGVKIKAVISKIENNFSLPKIEDFEKLISSKTKAILICNPGNPTGYLYNKKEIDQLAELVRKYDLFLIADEVYREFCYDGEKHHSIMSLDDLRNNAIMIDSVSKRYSMCGARIGCLITKNKEVYQTVMKFAQARLSPPSYAQIACEAAIDTPDSYFQEVVSEYTERRNFLVKELKKIPGVKVVNPKGAFYCIAELPVDDADDFAKWLLKEFRVNNQTVMIAPAAGFYSSDNLGKSQIRIAYVLKKKDLMKSVNILKLGLKAYRN
ncbi:MAG: aspartate aminotransferase [Flavobacteriaceae bacterium]|nr:aspartate aminotransferase [Flavobacteriaceae bacterium]|tara:strand:- start:1464 stop:2654 length:1191 start_codon:yes stop_codon:yes gene_type:complete